MTMLFEEPYPRPPATPFLTEAERNRIERCHVCGAYLQVRHLCRTGLAVNGGPVEWGPYSCDSCSANGGKPVPLLEDPIV